MAASFIFDPSKGETPETVASRRRTADALAARIFGRTPQNVGEGLNSLGQAWIAASMRDEANDAQKAGQASATDAFSKIQGLLTGGMPAAAPAAAATEAAPVPPTAPAVPMSGATGGDVQSYLDAVKMAESGGNPNARNPNSTASGLYQFTQGTWYDMIRKRPDLGLTPDGRFDPQQQEKAMQAFTDQNAGVLANAGIPINPANLYAAHFLGAGGARSVLAQPDNVPMPVAVGPEVVKANPFLANMTVGDFKNWTAKKMGGIQNAPVHTASAGAFPAPLPQMDDGASIPPAAQPAQGNLPPMQNAGDLQQLIAAASNPWLNEGQRAVVSAVLKQRLQEQDPMRQLQMEKLRADIDKTRGKAGTTEYGLNPIYGTDDQGNPVLGTLGKDGSFKQIDTGGVKVSTGVDKIDLGTQFAIYDKKSGQLIGYQPKDLRGAEREKGIGESQGKAVASAPADIQSGQNALDLLDKIEQHPYLERGTGFSSLANVVPGTGGYDFSNIVEQAKSGAFLQAIQQMRGLGSLSNAEGGAATAAVTRMNTASSKEAFLDALADYRRIVNQGIDRAKARIANPTDTNPSAVAPQNQGWQDVGGVKIRRKQ